MVIRLTLDAIINQLGNPEKQQGNEYLWQCPLCNDSGRDNLKFNSEKGILWCFANNNHASEILKKIIKNNRGKNSFLSQTTDFTKEEKYKRFFNPLKQIEFKFYMQESNEALLKSDIRLHSLKVKRGINRSTVKDVKLGIDTNKKRWVIPTFQYSTKHSKIILGFEYRPFNFSKERLTREKGSPTGMAMINAYTPDTKNLVVIEGYFDGYALYQHLKEQKQIQNYHIVTPSNGVNSLLKFMPEIDFSRYEKFYLYIDNDEAGNSMAAKVIEHYPMFRRIVTKCGCKDFNEHYMKCLIH